MAAETLDEALAAEEERAVRDQFRESSWDPLVELPLATIDPDADPEPDRRHRGLAEVMEGPRMLRPEADRAADVARLLLLLIVVATALALVWAAQVTP